ncbi:Ppx/GppA family phosphatase [Sphingomonas solaris]|uniref:Ppx/GppA family phosphatase n=1 Tax=Alterirhizorhabdus solaris TaxID=2529389 RepID=A0A558R063_9SPHN|nr:Ppx/GppA family phosphatase [Sphingomonas solaris]TVV72803.1 Ppx/GppA family phosphatase [Sphingomonas solaris]
MPAQPLLAAVETPGRVGIIDIGSNSIRLVVFDGPARIPSILFNEKVMAGLGAGLARDGALDAESIERGLTALARFARLAAQMEVTSLRTVATAAVREASNGAPFLARIRAMGLAVELLSGEEEAMMAGYGVLAAVPGATGIVGDLGGGSLELARVADGAVHERVSFPLGVLRIAKIRAEGPRALDRVVGKAIAGAGWDARSEGLPFYLVGGSWRALARLDMHLMSAPLPIIHHHVMAADRPASLVRVLAQIDRKRLREVQGLSGSRIATLPEAAGLLSVLVRRLGSSEMIVSGYGLREGLLHQSLPPAIRAQDPLICATREEGRRQGRFPEHGDLLYRWTSPLFARETPAEARLRHATCLLADVGWPAHPEFRAERGLETALHGNWVGVDARGRGMMARALYTSFGGDQPVPIIDRLTTPAERALADRWGLAMRLGQRLSGGVAEPLVTSRLSLDPATLTLHLRTDDGALYGEAVERRHKALATAFERKPALA